jgi:hypothetical protein
MVSMALSLTITIKLWKHTFLNFRIIHIPYKTQCSLCLCLYRHSGSDFLGCDKSSLGLPKLTMQMETVSHCFEYKMPLNLRCIQFLNVGFRGEGENLERCIFHKHKIHINFSTGKKYVKGVLYLK